MAENRVPCPNCSDGFVTTGDRHARTRQDVCGHCAGAGMVEARTGQTLEASFRPTSAAKPALPAGLSQTTPAGLMELRARVEGAIRRAFDRASEEDGRLEDAHDGVVDLLDTVISAVDRILAANPNAHVGAPEVRT